MIICYLSWYLIRYHPLQVAIAGSSCTHCAQINSVRPVGSLPFVCWVRASLKAIRDDGTVICALCLLQANRICNAKIAGQAAEFLNHQVEREERETLRNTREPSTANTERIISEIANLSGVIGALVSGA